MEPIRVKREIKKVEVVIENEDGSEDICSIWELTAPDRAKYVNMVSSRAQLNADGDVQRLTNYENVQESLLAKCLHTVDGKLMDIELIKKLPQSAVSTLYTAAQTLSALSQQGVDEAKND